METIAYWIHKRAEITPNRTAIISEGERVTYKELSGEVEKMASLLHHRYRLNKGERVAILSHNRKEYIIAYFAIAALGLVAVPLNIRLRGPELAFQLKDSGASLILYEEKTASLLKELNQHHKNESGYQFGEQLPVAAQQVPPVEIDAENDPYVICYTSGTTGRPKGAVLTQANMFWNALNNQYAIDITSKDVTHVLLPLFHIGGIGLFAFPTLLSGGTIVVPSKFDPERAIREIETYQITVVMGVPTIHDAMQKHPAFSEADFSSVRWFYSGGAPCPPALIRAFLDRGLPFGQGMGMTETSPTIFMLSREDYKRKVGSIGKPVLFCDIALLGDNGKPVKQGEVGELVLKGPNVMKEYWGLPEETSKAIRNGWFYTGDLMRQDEEGFIYVAGRKKDMIISGGENIYPLEVEETLHQLEEVREAAVIGMEDSTWGEVPVAFLSLEKEISTDEIILWCKQQLAAYKVPKTIHVLEELPKNATGKIDKGQLKNRLYAH